MVKSGHLGIEIPVVIARTVSSSVTISTLLINSSNYGLIYNSRGGTQVFKTIISQGEVKRLETNSPKTGGGRDV